MKDTKVIGVHMDVDSTTYLFHGLAFLKAGDIKHACFLLCAM
jgi:hypothetical protein